MASSLALPPFLSPDELHQPMGSRMNGMGFGWEKRRRVRDALVHEIQTIICSDLQPPKRNSLPGDGPAWAWATGTWAAAAGNFKRTAAFRSSPARFAAASCCTQPSRPGKAAGLLPVAKE